MTQSLEISFQPLQITYHFAQLGVPIPDARHGDSSVMHGLTAALEALTECSEAQLEKLKSPENKSKVVNLQLLTHVQSLSLYNFSSQGSK